MNLKLVVASMSVLGLVSFPVFAGTTTKHKHHHKVKHINVVQQDYKDTLPVQAPVVCTISKSSLVLDSVTQNLGRAMPNPCNPGWYNRIQVSGGVFVQNAWGNRNGRLMGEGYQTLALNDVYLNVSGNINDWSKAFVSLSYNTETINDPLAGTVLNHVTEYSSAYSNNTNGGSANQIQIEQAFATIGNFDVSPIYVQLGKQFQDFSRYEIHPITRSLTQVMSETLATSAKIGFIVPMGFNGALYAFNDPISKIGQSSTPTNYGASLGFDAPSDQLGWDIGAGYLYNLIGVNDVAYNVGQFNFNNPNVGNTFGYNTRVAGLALYGDVNSGPFTLGARWTTALQNFNVNDLPSNGIASLAATGVPVAGASGAKPWALGVQAGYGFEMWCHNQNIYLGYQRSHEAGGLQIPRNRYLAGYGIQAWHSTDVGIEWDHDNSYSIAHGGTGKTFNLVSLRAGVKFS